MINSPALDRLLTTLSGFGDAALPTLARATFAAVLLHYFWASALTKLDGPLTASQGGFAQIYPRAMAAAGYDATALGLVPKLVVLAGAWAELVLPLLLVLGLFTRLAALAMAGFVVVQSLTDVIGHMAEPDTIGAWFDRSSDALILDQRAFWLLLLITLVLKGAGPLSVDRAVRQWVSG